ncbi:hypothetical protein RB195_010376 [Necator americanus]|uniref:Uncharacterized protein n=1 Tax=Necator americanus TaxID=51031 RepID=A0ABR1CXP0_NECAM
MTRSLLQLRNRLHLEQLGGASYYGRVVGPLRRVSSRAALGAKAVMPSRRKDCAPPGGNIPWSSVSITRHTHVLRRPTAAILDSTTPRCL